MVILDLDEGIRDVYELLRMCTEIHMPVPSDRIAEAKIFQFEEELHLLGYDDVKQKIRKKETAPCQDHGRTGYDPGD